MSSLPQLQCLHGFTVQDPGTISLSQSASRISYVARVRLFPLWASWRYPGAKENEGDSLEMSLGMSPLKAKHSPKGAR